MRADGLGIADVAGDVVGANEYAGREEAHQEALRLWESMGRTGRPAVLHYLRGTEYRCAAVVVEMGPGR